MTYRIFYFPADGFYDEVPESLANEAIKAGGVDVTKVPGAIAAYEAEQREAA